MPGNIQVSILGLMDLPLPPPLNSLSLTVVMGKKEYRTVGGGELSLPVVSLRENLIVMVHDEEGEEFLRTEIKTMLLLEQEICYNVFPLKKGGSLHMKLQFLLSEDDQKRIREMRDSALKRRSFSDDRIGCSPTRKVAETVTEGMLLDHSESTDPIVEPYFGPRKKFPASRIGMGVIRTVVRGDDIPQTISKSFSAGMLSEISSEGKSKHAKQSFLLKKETQNSIPAMHYESLENSALECNEKIHKLDTGTELIKETKNKSSSKSGSYMTIDNGPQTIGSGKSRRLVAGISNKKEDFVSVDVEKGPSIIPIIRNFEAVREKGNLDRMRKDSPPRHSGADLVAAGDESNIAGKNCNTRNMAGDGNATLSEGFNRKIDMSTVDENNNEDWNLRNKSLPLDEKIEHSCQQWTLGDENTLVGHSIEQVAPGSSYEQVEALKSGYNSIGPVVNATLSEGFNKKIDMPAVDENNNEERNLRNKFLPSDEKIEHSCQQVTLGDENTLEDHSIEQVAPGSSYEQVEDLKSGYSSIGPIGNATLSEGFNKKIDMSAVDENNNEERNLRNKFLPLDEKIEHFCQQVTLADENTLEDHSIEQVAPGSSYEQVEDLKSGYNSICPIGISGGWIPRHVCVTTGSKLLREFADSFAFSLETNPIESSSLREADTKKDGDAYIQGNESKVVPSSGNSCIEKSPNSLESNGGLMEQGVWIVVITVACGLLLKGI